MSARRFEAWATETKRVELTAEAARQVAREIIAHALGVPLEGFIEGENLCVEHRVGGGSHSWFEKETVRPATDSDRAAVLVLRAVAVADLNNPPR